MRKKSLYIIVVMILAVILFYSNNKLSFEGVDGEYSIYTKSANSGPKVMSVSTAEACELKSNLKEIYGESVKIVGDKNTVAKLIAAYEVEILFREDYDGGYSFYGNSKQLGKGILLDGKRINFQIALSGNTVTVGTPIIFGSF